MRGTPDGRVRVALAGAAVLTTALFTAGVVHDLATTPVEEPAAVTWSPGQGAPAVVAVSAPTTTDTRNCGGYLAGQAAGSAVPEAR